MLVSFCSGGSRICERVVPRNSGAHSVPKIPRTMPISSNKSSAFPAFPSLNKAQAHWPQSANIRLRAVFLNLRNFVNLIGKNRRYLRQSYDCVYYYDEIFLHPLAKRRVPLHPWIPPPRSSTVFVVYSQCFMCLLCIACCIYMHSCSYHIVLMKSV